MAPLCRKTRRSAAAVICLTLPLAALAAPREIAVEHFEPKPIRVTLESLPKPYATKSASKSPKIVPMPERPLLRVPPGFKVSIYAEDLDRPRWLVLSPEGDVLVTETRQNRIRRLRDTDRDGTADEISEFAAADNGLDQPFGMAFAHGYFYLGNTDAILRFPYRREEGRLSGKGQKIADLPGGGYNQHWTRNVAVSRDGEWLYVSIGSKSNASPEEPPRASILRLKPDGTQQSIYASGLRNPIGLAVHPESGALYTVVNERDGLGDDLVPDYLTQVKEGGFYGWPYAYLSPQLLDPRLAKDGKSQAQELAASTLTPDVLFEAHSAPMQLVFGDKSSFPARYKYGAFVTFRGSWNRSQGTGYKIVFVPFTFQHRPEGHYEDFLTGFLLDPAAPAVWGRPVGLVFLPDGSLLFADEEGGQVFRISYKG